MCFKFYSMLLLGLGYVLHAAAVSHDSLPLPPTVASNATLALLSSRFVFTEGPAADKKGNVYFTDQPNNKIWKYDTHGKLSVFLDQAGRANGLFFDRKGMLIACADEKDELWAISPKGNVTVLVNNFGGHRLNGPNDVWVAPNGGIYFTDPYYQRDYWNRKTADIKEERVYYLAPGAKEAIVAADDLKKPNGILGTRDGKLLYIVDIGTGKNYSYQIAPDGSLHNRQLLVEKVTSDGLALDAAGNVYLCGNGITVVNKNGQQIGYIPVPEHWTGNACFGGKDNNILFITAGKSVYTLKMSVKGGE
ncbi:SMP-30/gluconolactonase/LRE family protein [Chitinophaga sp. 30R24]|uniref:SMP-30/gluconolactonase/LRE family protein n=1 Tax=Chitinophaga sp. 30R24 TaxID=3248838 RepID=UPI003B8F6261